MEKCGAYFLNAKEKIHKQTNKNSVNMVTKYK